MWNEGSYVSQPNRSSLPPPWVEDDRRQASLRDSIRILGERLETLGMLKRGIVDYIENWEAETNLKRTDFLVELGKVQARMDRHRLEAEEATYWWM